MSSSAAAAERINEKLISSSKTPSPGAPVSSAYATSAESVILPAPSASSPSKGSLYGKSPTQNTQSHQVPDPAHSIAYDPATFSSEEATAKLRGVLIDTIKNTMKLEQQYKEIRARGWNIGL